MSDPEKPKLDLRHGLCFDRQKNRWFLRISISRGRKLVSKRVKITFDHGDTLSTAIAKRELILKAMRALGIVIVQRSNQRRAKREGGGE